MMKERKYLFSFNFEKNTINNYVVAFLEEREIDYFYSYEQIYADIFGEDKYYKLTAENVCRDCFDVYYETEKTKDRMGTERMYPLVNKAIMVQPPARTINLSFADGSSIIKLVNGDKDKIEDFYSNALFLQNGKEQKATRVEFVA